MSGSLANPTAGSTEGKSLTRDLARALVRSLSRGTAVAQGARHIHVGHENWLAAQHELLEEIAEDGHSDTKFVRGAYGAGKSHFLSVVQDRARDAGWVTSHIECKVDKVQIDRFETLYPQIAIKLLSQDLLDARAARGDTLEIDAVRFVLERWTRAQLRAAGVKDNGLTKPFDADTRLYLQFQNGLFKSNLPPDFTRALAGFARGFLASDFETQTAVCGWLRGVAEKIRIPTLYLQKPNPGTQGNALTELRPIGRGTAHEAMRGLLWLVRAAGYRGLVLCIDEVEELAKLGTKKRQDQALQALREYVDHAGGEGGYRHLCMYLAATPDMFESEQYFPRYDALATRIQALSPELNWRAPVVDLDRTPLQLAQMNEMADRIWSVHRTAYGVPASREFGAEFVSELVSKIVGGKMRVAKPRLLARVMIDELERARQTSGVYARPENLDQLLVRTAKQISREAESE
jgi:hypothetical protein